MFPALSSAPTKKTHKHTHLFWLYMTYWIFGNVHSSWRVKNWGALLLIWFTKCHSWYTMSPWGCFYLIHLLWLWWVMIHISPPVFLFTIPLPAEMKAHNTNRVVWKDTITMVNRGKNGGWFRRSFLLNPGIFSGVNSLLNIRRAIHFTELSWGSMAKRRRNNTNKVNPGYWYPNRYLIFVRPVGYSIYTCR